ncbi:small conductance calcium-activated potassium channel protein 2-like isoform X2 [Littorina saxatilis]|uniref:small conductance calcium-activated potassium channel protein 2-like isoform X2 n=1 Tax=Littorina saxatilis TaxID=31220 RepID=UPI0038B6AF23
MSHAIGIDIPVRAPTPSSVTTPSLQRMAFRRPLSMRNSRVNVSLALARKSSRLSLASNVIQNKSSNEKLTPRAKKLSEIVGHLTVASEADQAIRQGLGCSGWDLFAGVGTKKWDNISYRLSRRKQLIERSRCLVDVGFLLAMLGVLVMLLEAELFLQGVISKLHIVSVTFKLIVTVSTVCLLIAVVAYHVTRIQLSMVDDGIEHWGLAVRPSWIGCILLELFICSIHPLPGQVYELSLHQVESVLSILMFLRLYIAARFFVVHSSLVTDTATQSLGALNKVKIDGMFVFKAVMSERPGSLLIVMMGVIFVLSSWSVHACDAYMAVYNNMTIAQVPGQTLENAMWMSAITFLTVGYGDVTPKSECGRVTAVVTGLLGVGSTALLVAVLAQKLEQSRSEKYVHSFVSRVTLDKVHKHAAADVIKSVLKLWRMRRQTSAVKNSHRTQTQGKLLQGSASRTRGGRGLFLGCHSGRMVDPDYDLYKAVRRMREIKQEKANIGEAAVGIIEVNSAVGDVYQITEAIAVQQALFNDRAEEMDTRLSNIENTLENIANAVIPD